MRVLITGVAGFIGSGVAKALLDRYDFLSVVGVDNMDAYYDISLKNHRLAALLKSPRFEFRRGDIADRDFLETVFEEFRPQYVLNFAAKVGVRHSVLHPEDYIAANINGFFNILESCRKYPVRHLVFASSSSVYGASDHVPYSVEDRTDAPVSLYAATKKSNELMAHAYSGLYDIPCTGLRFFTVYGPAGRPDMAYFKFTDSLVRGEKIDIYNYGKCLRDFTYIDDVVEAVVRVMMAPPEKSDPVKPPYAVYNVGNGDPVTLVGFVRILHEELLREGVLPEGHDCEAHMNLIPMQQGDMQTTYADTSSLERDFGFSPSTSLREGLRAFAHWYKEYVRG